MDALDQQDDARCEPLSQVEKTKAVVASLQQSVDRDWNSHSDVIPTLPQDVNLVFVGDGRNHGVLPVCSTDLLPIFAPKGDGREIAGNQGGVGTPDCTLLKLNLHVGNMHKIRLNEFHLISLYAYKTAYILFICLFIFVSCFVKTWSSHGQSYRLGAPAKEDQSRLPMQGLPWHGHWLDGNGQNEWKRTFERCSTAV